MRPFEELTDADKMSYKEAALLIGVTHNYVRMLVRDGRIKIVERVEVRPNVLKVFVSGDDVRRIIEERKPRFNFRVSLTPEEYKEFQRLFPGRYDGKHWKTT